MQSFDIPFLSVGAILIIHVLLSKAYYLPCTVYLAVFVCKL